MIHLHPGKYGKTACLHNYFLRKVSIFCLTIASKKDIIVDKLFYRKECLPYGFFLQSGVGTSDVAYPHQNLSGRKAEQRGVSRDTKGREDSDTV
jgi:hypothetical protein